MKNILVFAPHPDDATIGMGGTIAKYTRQKRVGVHVVYMTSGGYTDNSKIREGEAVNALTTLGCHQSTFLRLPDQHLKVTIKAMAHVKKIIKQQKPWVIYIPAQEEQHKDHKATYKIVTTALKDLPFVPVKMYEVWPGLDHIDNKEVVDITSFISAKKAALAQFSSQHLNLIEAYTCLALFRGIFTGVADYVECFKKYDNK